MSQEKLAAYLRVQSAYNPAAVPGRKAAVFITKKTGMPQGWLWEEEAGVRQLTDFPDRIMGLYVAPDGKRLVVGSDANGNEKEQFHLMNIDGGQAETLVDSPEHFHQFGGWSPDGKRIVYSSNRRQPGFFDVYILEVEAKEETLVFRHDGNCQPVAWLKDNKRFAIQVQETNLDSSLYLFHTETGERQQIGGEGQRARFQSLKFGEDGKSGFVLSDTGRDTLALYRFDVERPGDLVQLASDDQWDLEGIALSMDGNRLLYTINEGGRSAIRLLDLTSGQTEPVTGFPAGVVDSIHWLDEQEFLFSLKSPVLPGDLWRHDLVANRTERLTSFGRNEAIEADWVEAELASFESFDKLEVPYFFYGEKGASKPVVIYVHGGPEYQIRAEFNPVIQYLASEGFNVVTPNVRGSMGYGRKYVQLDDARKRMDAVADLAGLAAALVESESADPERIAVMGRSYGGFMVLAALTHYPNLWAAGIDIVGISHFRTFLENTGDWRRKLREAEYGSLAEDTDFFEEIAPLNHSGNITAPLLMFHGRNDTRVPVTEAEQLYSDLKQAGKEVELIVFENEGHQTEKLENHIHMNEKTVQFLNQHLKG